MKWHTRSLEVAVPKGVEVRVLSRALMKMRMPIYRYLHFYLIRDGRGLEQERGRENTLVSLGGNIKTEGF